EVCERGERENLRRIVPRNPERADVRPVEQAERGGHFVRELVTVFDGYGAAQLDPALGQTQKVGRGTGPVRPERSTRFGPTAQEAHQVVTGDAYGFRLQPRLLEQPQRPFDRSPLARGHQHPERTFGRARQSNEVEANVLWREGDVTLQLECHHLVQLSAARGRHLEDLDGEQRTRESDAHPAKLEFPGLQLGLEAGAWQIAWLEREAVDLITTVRAHGDHQPLVS